jgi:hypothetical protein
MMRIHFSMSELAVSRQSRLIPGCNRCPFLIRPNRYKLPTLMSTGANGFVLRNAGKLKLSVYRS